MEPDALPHSEETRDTGLVREPSAGGEVRPSIDSFVDALFPFNFEVQRDLRVVRVGPAFGRRFNSFREGVLLPDSITVVRPTLALDFTALQNHSGRLVVLKLRAGDLMFTGQFVDLPHRSTLLFIGGPWVASIEDMKAFRLKLSDFPPHDPRADLLLQAQARDTMLRDLAETNRQMKEAEEKNRVLQDHFARLQRVEIAGQVAGGLAHNFNNLLAIIQGQIELAVLRIEAGDTEGARDRLSQVSNAASDAAELVKQLGTLSVDRRAEIEEVDLLDTIERAKRLVQPLLGRQVVWEIASPAGARPVALCDRGGLQEVLLNLAINAAEAMKGSGRILSTVTLSAETEAATLGVPRGANSLLCLTFEDTGPGIPDEFRHKAFEPFFTTKGENHSGLGLATVEHLVMLSGGAVRLVSREGSGATFKIFLTAAATVAAAPPRRVLIVDDEPAVLELLAQVLEMAGFATEAFNDPTKALHAMESGSRFDVIVSDVRMPGVSGLELVRRAEELMGPRPTVFVTGFAEGVFTGNEAPVSGPYTVLAKPFRIAQLTEAINKVTG